MADSTDTWRVFIAIELPAAIRASLSAHITHLRKAMPEVRASWSREDNLHLTLKFLGDIPTTNVEQLSAAASLAATRIEPFEIFVEGCGSFPPRGQPRVLWIGIEDPSAELAELHKALEHECGNAGFAREPRAFHPHLTIARIRQPHGSRQLAELHKEIGFEREAISVSELAVIRSELRTEGSKHTVISRHGLRQ
jgi:2'-5' RNA ligase